MPSVEKVWKTNAGAHLFNGISRMQLVDRDGNPIRFSRKIVLTRQVIGLLLEAGYVPQDMTQRVE